MNVTIRSAQSQDAQAVARVVCESRAAFVAFAPMAHTPTDVAGWVEQTLIPAGGVYVATLDSRIIGALAVSVANETSWIDQLYVLPGYTGQGLGSQLLQHAHSVLRLPIRLFTFQANYGARKFYERHGYIAIEFTDGANNEERCPDILYEYSGAQNTA